MDEFRFRAVGTPDVASKSAALGKWSDPPTEHSRDWVWETAGGVWDSVRGTAHAVCLPPAPRQRLLAAAVCPRRPALNGPIARMGRDMTATRMLNAAPPPVQRLSILLLAVPLIVWTATWLDWRLAVPLTAALLHPLVRLCRGPWREWARPFQPALGLLAALFALTSVPGGINWVSGDFWDFHALLRALADGPWPSALDASLYPEPVLMRRYMGWYLWPAMTARPFGGAALSVIVPLYMTACGWLALALLCGNRTPREAFPGGLVFLGSWGMYLAMWIVGNLVEVHEQHLWGTVYLPRFGHWFAAALQPHHWLPAVLGATLAVQTASSAATRTHRMPILVPAVVFWSPWATAGLIPVGLWWLHRRRGDFRPADLAAALPATLVAGVCVSAYLLSGATDFYRGWLWTHLKPVDVLLWMALPLITAAPHAYLLWDRDNAVPASLRRLAFGMLLVVPLWHMGSVNDWTPNTLLVPATVLGMAWLNRLWRWGRDNRGGAVGLVLFVACLQLAGHLLWSTTYDNQTLPNYAEPPRHDELALAWQAENVAPPCAPRTGAHAAGRRPAAWATGAGAPGPLRTQPVAVGRPRPDSERSLRLPSRSHAADCRRGGCRQGLRDLDLRGTLRVEPGRRSVPDAPVPSERNPSADGGDAGSKRNFRRTAPAHTAGQRGLPQTGCGILRFACNRARPPGPSARGGTPLTPIPCPRPPCPNRACRHPQPTLREPRPAFAPHA